MRPESSSTGFDYFKQAATFRLCLQYNQEDYRFASDGQIVYVMDANVVAFFMDPLAEMGKHLGAFDEGEPATVVVTAEFLFSRQLAGQNGLAALIAPAHALEIDDMIAGLRRKAASAAAPEPPIEVRSELDSLVRRFEDGKVTASAAEQRFRELVPELTIQYLGGGPRREGNSVVAQTHQLSRLYEQQLALPLHTHTSVTEDILHLSGNTAADMVDLWTERIRNQHALTRRGLDGRPRQQQLFGHDAEVLAQVMLLDQVAGNRTRFVLVTADNVLFDAYASWFYGDRRAIASRGRFVLRTLRQYVPMLNVREMPNGIEDSGMLALTRETLDTLLSSIQSLDGSSYPHVLALYRSLDGSNPEFVERLTKLYGFNPLSFDELEKRRLDGLSEIWTAACRDGALLNGELLDRRLHGLLSGFVRILRSEVEVRKSFHETQQQLLGKVERRHLQVTLEKMLRFLNFYSKRRDLRRDTRWTQPLLRERFAQFLSGMDPDQGLQCLARDGNDDKAFIDNVKSLVDEADSGAFFFVSWLAHCCGLWEAAWHHARRAAAGNVHDPKTRNEIDFLRVSTARRFFPIDHENIREAFRTFDRLAAAAEAAHDQLGLTSVLGERSALWLFLIKASAIDHSGDQTPTAAAIKAVSRSQGFDLEANLAALGSPGANGTPTALPAPAQAQAVANIVGVAVAVLVLSDSLREFGHLLPKRSSVIEAFSQLPAWVQPDALPPALAAEHAMCRRELGQLDFVETRNILIDVRARVDGGSLGLSFLERSEINHLVSMLDGAIEARGQRTLMT